MEYEIVPPCVAGYESWGYYRPCPNECGDLLVIRPIPGRGNPPASPTSRLLIALGDVAGTGESAARLKSYLSDAVGRRLTTNHDPASLLGRLNRHLFERANGDRFTTLLLAAHDSERGEMIMANAGHQLPLMRRAGGKVEMLGDEELGAPLGIMPDLDYQPFVVPIDPGDIIILFSDGVTATYNDRLGSLKPDLLMRAIGEAQPSPASVGRAILAAIREFGGGSAQPDDITVFCLGRIKS